MRLNTWQACKLTVLLAGMVAGWLAVWFVLDVSVTLFAQGVWGP